jgi:hypothetical protein
VLSRRYLTRQASALIKFAKSTNNPKLAAVLVNRAADLKAQVDETMPPVNPSPHAPDVEPQSSDWRPQMTPQVLVRRYTASEICDVVVSVRGQEIILRCPNYPQALKWARLECKSYKIPEPEVEPLISGPEIEPHISEPEIEPGSGLDHDEDDALDHDEELPLFLRSAGTTES